MHTMDIEDVEQCFDGEAPKSITRAPSRVYMVRWRDTDGKLKGMTFWSKAYATSTLQRLRTFGIKNPLLLSSKLEWIADED